MFITSSYCVSEFLVPIGLLLSWSARGAWMGLGEGTPEPQCATAAARGLGPSCGAWGWWGRPNRSGPPAVGPHPQGIPIELTRHEEKT